MGNKKKVREKEINANEVRSGEKEEEASSSGFRVPGYNCRFCSKVLFMTTQPGTYILFQSMKNPGARKNHEKSVKGSHVQTND